MKNEKQIVLFLEKNTEFSELKIATEISEKFPELGRPATMPFNSTRPNDPMIIFNQGIMNVTMNRNDLAFIYNREDDKKCFEMVKEIIELIEDYNIKFIRLGYVSTYLHTKKDREKFISNTFKDSKLVDDEFNLAWYKNELIDSVRVNVWERHLTDMMNNVDYVTILDINTPASEEYNITSDFTYNFIKECDKYITKLLQERL